MATTNEAARTSPHESDRRSVDELRRCGDDGIRSSGIRRFLGLRNDVRGISHRDASRCELIVIVNLDVCVEHGLLVRYF